ncbi:hypothetical protein [Oryza sativa Japonica Group]|uniref:Uncharacterized protein n=2 Tax=Oryza sativa subsp. japonica TaxID=39947 RepID=Q7F6Q1_ORYSJ|nr:hypothetical protein [Oryza sativa Japonica Group]BAB55737.1 hypothetical protein [Oryza sativa Japonica Group]
MATERQRHAAAMRPNNAAYAEELGRATAAPMRRGAAERRLGASVAARRRGPGAGTTRLAASAVRLGSGADVEELGRATAAPMRRLSSSSSSLRPTSGDAVSEQLLLRVHLRSSVGA